MTSNAHLISPLAPPVAYDGVCPCCKGGAYRIQRRPLDRLVDCFWPVYRYRCGVLGCSWEGILIAPRK